jgi:hypothetical protein
MPELPDYLQSSWLLAFLACFVGFGLLLWFILPETGLSVQSCTNASSFSSWKELIVFNF